MWALLSTCAQTVFSPIPLWPPLQRLWPAGCVPCQHGGSWPPLSDGHTAEEETKTVLYTKTTQESVCLKLYVLNGGDNESYTNEPCEIQQTWKELKSTGFLFLVSMNHTTTWMTSGDSVVPTMGDTTSLTRSEPDSMTSYTHYHSNRKTGLQPNHPLPHNHMTPPQSWSLTAHNTYNTESLTETCFFRFPVYTFFPPMTQGISSTSSRRSWRACRTHNDATLSAYGKPLYNGQCHNPPSSFPIIRKIISL